MQLLKMELKGFKSFADKTTLTFDKGITAIVGPNGSGKSNISDAVRWVMGEQNVRNLRGQKAEDIIFSGTQTRRPQGAAEVSLYFDNSDRALDTDFTEVVVTRRLLRSGDSEYYINKRACRLKDIHHLFADTGIGQDSMAVIGQNRVDRILNSKPEERRVIFEEVAGISRFKGRKAEGLKKIAETERNLERIGDLQAALEAELEPLSQEAEKLKTFRQLDSERRAYEGTVALQELENSERLWQKEKQRQEAAASEEKEAQAEVTKAEKKQQELAAAQEKDDETLRSLDEAALAVHHELDSLVQRREAALLRQQELAESQKRQEAEQAQRQERLAHWQAEEKELLTQQEQKQSEREAAEQALQLSQSLHDQAAKKAAAAEAAFQEKAAADAKRSQELFSLRRDCEDLHQRLDVNEENLAKALQALEKAAAEKEKRLRHQKETQVQVQGLEEKKAAQQKHVAALNEKTKQAEAAAKKSQENWRAAQRELTAKRERIHVLQEMAQDYEGLGKTVKTVLTAQAPWRSGLCGVVGELCQLPKEYAVAIDVALGGAARYIVAETEDTAKAAITFLKKKKAGRATFLPLDTLRVRPPAAEEEKASHENGILGFANTVLTCEEKYQPVFASLLGRILLADTLETGSRVARKYRQRLRIVCLDGTQFNPGGSLTGGSSRKQETSFIGRQVLLESLQEDYAKAKADGKALQEQAEESRSQAEAAIRERAAADKALADLTLDLQQAGFQAAQAKQAYALWQNQMGVMEKESQRIDAERAQMQAEVVEKEKKLHAREGEPAAADLARYQTARDQAQQEAAQCQQHLTERQIALAALKEQVRHAKEQISQHGAWKKELDAQADQLEKQQADTKARAAETVALLQALEKNITQKKEATAQADRDKTAFYQARDNARQQARKLSEDLTALRQRQQEWQEKSHAAALQAEKYKGDMQRQEEQLARQGLTRAEAEKQSRPGSRKEVQTTLFSLRQQIAALGPVNPAADQAYQNAQEKRDFYSRQCEDLVDSREKLRAVVAEIDAAMASQFSQAFTDIGRHFQQIFSRLFGGGTARLALTDSQHILETGIEIYIQPPGKKQQSLTLLSGGERALTVIALLLAFLAYHPAPFCLVDEVDAALDEANVERMARYLKNYSGATQFIVITHRRKTMEAANTLLGVTMEEKGVSRLLSVKVDDFIKEGS